MGWKAECILINEREEGYLGTFPTHSEQRAVQLIEGLPLPYNRVGEVTTLEDGIYPKTLTIGAYEGAVVIGLPSIDTYLDPASHSVKLLLQMFPAAKILCMQLHSVVNLFGYAVYENGEFRRLRRGSADASLVADEGQPLPLEQPLFERSIVRNGERYFYGTDDGEYDESAFGEEFVFTLSTPFFGTRCDSFAIENLHMQCFHQSSWWSRLFGG